MKNQKEWPDRYSPEKVEQSIYQWWEDHHYFSTSQKENNRQFFSVILPPPNVTGSLHLGHALNHTIQDCLIRWKKMSGYQTTWFSGTDHAGIATQIQVEKELAKNNQNKHQLGREKFLEKMWEWKHKNADQIIHQMKRLGDSCDWSQHLFTLDKDSVKAVKKTFVHLYQKGFIYQGTRLVNWSSGLSSAISDLEVEYKEVSSYLWYIRYPIKDTKDFILIATTRPETLLADQAIAVHPEDDRYKKYHNQFVHLPLTDRVIPIITDSYVDTKFGTGALKITPAHDFNDYQIAKKHQLPEMNLLTENGRFNQNAGKYQNLTPFEARKKIELDLKTQGLLRDKKPHSHQVGFCSRSGSIIEPFLSKQWFLKMDTMAKRNLQVMKEKQIELIPRTWVKTFNHWMNQIDDWCISRQLWWGHSIPAWLCMDCKKTTVAEETPSQCVYCSSKNLKADPDVLDTWFSSALWPMSVLRWPRKNIQNNPYYPSSVLVTAPDILFFWVARMMMMGLEFQQQIPFKKVYLHGVVRDHKGRKMSKSLGNGEDPIELIQEYGADALRLALLYSHAKGRDVLFSKNTLKVCRNFMNKIWNASRFIYQSIDSSNSLQQISISSKDLSSADHWILSELQKTEKKVNQELEDFRFSSACLQIYQFTWMQFCDWYIEFIKPIVYSKQTEQKKITQYISCHVFNHILRLLHPFIPFITEEIYQKWSVKNCKTIMLDHYPNGKEKNLFSLINYQQVHQTKFLKELIFTIRQLRGENHIKPSQTIPVVEIWLQPDSDKNKKELIGVASQYIQPLLQQLKKLTHINDVQIKLNTHTSTNSLRATSPLSVGIQNDQQTISVTLSIPLKGLIDVQNEINRLNKKIHQLQSEQQMIQKQLNNSEFVSKAPKDIVLNKKEKLTQIQTLIQTLNDSKNKLNNNKEV